MLPGEQKTTIAPCEGSKSAAKGGCFAKELTSVAS